MLAALLGYAYTWAEAQTGARSRVLPLGQLAVQRILFDVTDESAVKRAVVARDGQVLITADGDGAVSLVTTATGASEVLRRAARVNGLGLSAEGDTMIEWDANGPGTVRDLGTREVRELPPLLADVVVAAITPSEIRVVSGAGQLARFPRRLPDGPTLDARLAALTNATLDRGGHFVAR